MPKRKINADEGTCSNRTKTAGDPILEVTEKVLSPFEALPTEILQQIMHNLTPFAYLNVKFVCRRLNTATKNVSGGAFVFHKYTAPHPVKTPSSYSRFYNTMVKHKIARRKEQTDFGAVMARIEASLSPGIKRSCLTCYECGKIAGIALKGGFCDEEFQLANGLRRCLDCQCKADATGVLTSFHIRRKAFHRCGGCRAFKPEAFAIREANVKNHYKESELDLVLAEFQKKTGNDDKICTACYSDVTAKALGSHLENERKGSFRLFNVRAR